MKTSEKNPDQAMLLPVFARLSVRSDFRQEAEKKFEIATYDEVRAINAFRDLLRRPEISNLDGLFGFIMSAIQLLNQPTLREVFKSSIKSANLDRDIRLELADKLIQAFVKDAISNDCLTIKSWHLGLLDLIMFFSSKEAMEVSTAHEISCSSWSEFIELQRKERARFMYETIQDAQGNMSEAARLLGIQRTTLMQNIGTLRKEGNWPYD